MVFSVWSFLRFSDSFRTWFFWVRFALRSFTFIPCARSSPTTTMMMISLAPFSLLFFARLHISIVSVSVGGCRLWLQSILRLFPYSSQFLGANDSETPLNCLPASSLTCLGLHLSMSALVCFSLVVQDRGLCCASSFYWFTLYTALNSHRQTHGWALIEISR